MAYRVNAKDQEIIIEDGTVNTDTPLKLIGRDYFGYGDEIAQNFIDLLGNFAGAEAPTNPVVGNTWFGTDDEDKDTFNIWNGLEWLRFAFNSYTVYDTEDLPHTVFVIMTDSTVVCVVSGDPEFTLSSSNNYIGKMTRTLYNIWGTNSKNIKQGINLNPSTDNGIFKLHGTATEAEYADVAELYASDAEYAPGTVVKLGGSAEVTQTTAPLCDNVFGVVSTNPAYLMNSTLAGTSVAVALSGRVPCRVIGEVRKGQRLVASETPGVARVATEHEHSEGLDWFRVIGRALEDKTTLAEGKVEIVVGTK